MPNKAASSVGARRFLCGSSFLLLFRGTFGQEYPTLLATPGNGTASFRQDVCQRHRIFNRGEAELRDALAGVQLRPAVGTHTPDFFRTTEDGAIDEIDPGVMARLLDEMARRGGFTWRDSYGTYSSLADGLTWTDLAVWAADTYDFVVDYWYYNTERLGLGLTFLPGWYDASFIMVAEEEVKTKSNIFSWLAPFDYKVWIMIGVMTVSSGIVYRSMDALDQLRGHEEMRFSNPTDHYFLASLAVTGHFEYHPKTFPTMLFAGSIAFMSILLMSAYTANLASFFVVENTPTLGIDKIEDAVVRKIPICLWKDTAVDTLLSRRFQEYDGFVRVGGPDETEVIKAAVGPDRKCRVAVTSVSAWDGYRDQRDVNPDCKLTWIGRVIEFVPGAFIAKADSGTLCSSLIRDVLSLHLEEMKAEGFVARVWEDYLRSVSNQDCKATDLAEEGGGEEEGSAPAADGGEEDEDTQQLTLQGLGGAFLVQLVLATAAVIVSVFKALRDERSKKRKRMGAAMESLGDPRASRNGVADDRPLEPLGEEEREFEDDDDEWHDHEGAEDGRLRHRRQTPAAAASDRVDEGAPVATERSEVLAAGAAAEGNGNKSSSVESINFRDDDATAVTPGSRQGGVERTASQKLYVKYIANAMENSGNKLV